MIKCRAMVGLAAALLLSAGKAEAEDKAKEPFAEIETGARVNGAFQAAAPVSARR
jgi:hypothetical protein